MTSLMDKMVLIIDDDINLCRTLKYGLIEEGASVIIATDGRIGIQKFEEQQPDLVLLDIRMPELDGWETMQYLRMISGVPIIMLTSLKEDQDMIRGLNLGADDYVIKPFNHEVLLARIESVMRRGAASKESPNQKSLTSYQDDYLSINLDKREIYRDADRVKLSTTEMRILSCLMQKPNQCVAYVDLLESVWGKNFKKDTDYLHVYLSHLRKKLEKDPRNPQYLINEYRTGYIFKTM
ncbi:MAG: response regulator transcription factor [Chloroflexota bacterium]